MRIFITGVNGELGHGLVDFFSSTEAYEIVGLDINSLDLKLKGKIMRFYKGDVCDRSLINKIILKGRFDVIFHFAAVLSTSGERNPELAHKVNVEGMFNLLSACNKAGRVVKFLFPSSIAVYGVKKNISKKVKEDRFLDPITMYGINKLYCENLGVYFSENYKLLGEKRRLIDFRSVRFPGLMSVETLPTGGTTDYAPGMLHSAMKRENYECFVREDTKLPFMAMGDGVKALVLLMKAPKKKLTRRIYNVASFSAAAKDFEIEAKKIFPKMKVVYKVDKNRQRIVDSWPEDVNDSLAKEDWDWRPKFDFLSTIKQFAED